MLTPNEFAAKWNRNLAAAGESMRQGIQAVTVNPAEKAIAAQERYVQGVMQAAADGKYRQGLQRVSLQDWKQSMLQKGVPRVAQGAANAVGKMEQFAAEFLPYLEQGQRQLQSMPRGDLQQNIARAVAMMQHNAQFRRRS